MKIFSHFPFTLLCAAMFTLAGCSGDDDTPNIGGTYTFRTASEQFRTGHYLSAWDSDLEVLAYTITATTDPNARPGAARPDSYIIVTASENLMGQNFDMATPPETDYAYYIRATFRFGGDEVLQYSAERSWDGGKYVTNINIGHGRTVNSGVVTITRPALDTFTVDAEIDVDGERLFCDFEGVCKKEFYS